MKWPAYLFFFVMAIIVANREIQTEGTGGWAKNLPTWRHQPADGLIWRVISMVMMAGHEVTGYHLYHIGGLLLWFHLPFFFDIKWNWANEFRVISLFIIWSNTQDFLWFVFNPNFRVFGGFNGTTVPWHQFWGPVPKDYFFALVFSLGIACLGDLPRFNFHFCKELSMVWISYAIAAISLAAFIPKNWEW